MFNTGQFQKERLGFTPYPLTPTPARARPPENNKVSMLRLNTDIRTGATLHHTGLAAEKWRGA